MEPFKPRAITFQGRVATEANIDQVFPLFSPAGEKLWVPGWNPEFLYPPDVEWAQGQIFRTEEEMGDAVWVVTRLDRKARRVEYYRIEPGRCVARVEVNSRALSDDRTETSIAYSFIGLSDVGNDDIVAMTQQDYDAKMARWTKWIEEYLNNRHKSEN